MIERAIESLGDKLSIARSYDLTTILEKNSVTHFLNVAQATFSFKKYKEIPWNRKKYQNGQISLQKMNSKQNIQQTSNEDF